MPKKKPLKIPRDKLIIEKLPDGTAFIIVDSITSEFHHKQPQPEFFLCLLTSHPDKLPQFGYIVPFQRNEANLELILELERRASKGLPTQDTAVPHWPELTPAIQIWIDAKVNDGDFQVGGKVSIACGVLKNLAPRIGAELRQRLYIATSRIQPQPGHPPAYLPYEEWRGWRLLSEQWVRDLWEWTGAGMTLPADWSIKADDSDESVFLKIRDFDVRTEREEKISLLATICLLFNHWERRKLSLDHRAFHLSRLDFRFKIDRASLSNWTAAAGCSPKSKSLLLAEFQALQKRAYQYFERHPDEYAAWSKRRMRFMMKVMLNAKDDWVWRFQKSEEVDEYISRKLGTPIGGPEMRMFVLYHKD